MDGWMDGWMDVLKYKCIYNIVIPVVYNICTQCIIAGPLGQVTETIAHREKC